MPIIRRVAPVSDFEFEFQLALMNRKLNERVGNHIHDAERHLHLSEFAIVKEMPLGGRCRGVCALAVQEALITRLVGVAR